MHRSPIRPVPVAVVALLATCAGAQTPAPMAAPAFLLDRLQLSSAEIVDVAASPNDTRQRTVRLLLGGRLRTLDLHAHDLLAPDFQLLVDDGATLTRIPTPRAHTYRGTVRDELGSAVAVSLAGGQIEGMVSTATDTWWVEPLSQHVPGAPPVAHLVYRGDAVTATPTCGLAEGGVPAPTDTVPPAPNGATLLTEIAFDATFDFYQLRGSSTTNVQSTITRTLNAVDVIYQRDVNITFLLTTTIIRTTRVYNATQGGSLLTEFANRWTALHSGVRRDVAHMLAGISTTTVGGVAFRGSVCQSSGYAVTWHQSSVFVRTGVMAHEIGHCFNARHCNSVSPCHLMCAQLYGCGTTVNAFGPSTISTITAFSSRAGCLSPAGPPPSINSVSPSATTSWQPGTITVTGAGLDLVNSVTLNNVPVASFSAPTAGSLTFTPPSPFDIGTHTLAVSSPLGSASTTLTITGNHPGVFVAPILVLRQLAFDYDVHTDRNWVAALFVSPSNTPSALPGVVSLGIGAGFTSLTPLMNVAADNTGRARVSLTLPLTVPSSTPLYWQAITFGQSITLPLEVTNVALSTVF